MSTKLYHIILDATAAHDAELETTELLYWVIDGLVGELGLPIQTGDGAPIVYGLFVEVNGTRQRLSRSIRLAETPYAAGGTLYLALAYAPWWERNIPATPHLNNAPPQRSAPDHRFRLKFPPLALAISGLGLLSVILLLLFFPRNQPAIARIPQATALAVVAVRVPTITLAPVPPTLTPQPTPTPAITVERIAPDSINVIQGPILITMTGTFAGDIHAALVPIDASLPRIALMSRIDQPTLALLTAEEPVAPINGTAVYDVVINDRPVAKVTLQDFLRSVQAQGILSRYTDRSGRLFIKDATGFGAFLWNEADLQTKVRSSDKNILIHNGDTLDILDDHVAKVYQVRIRDEHSIGTTASVVIGWLPRWLVDNRNVPPAPEKPIVFAATLFDKPSDGNIVCGQHFESKIWGVVKDKAGRGVYRAVVRVTSADGRNSYTSETNDQGGFVRPGLGCTTWRVELIGLPGAPKGFRASSISVDLNGGAYSGAGVQFRQQQ